MTAEIVLPDEIFSFNPDAEDQRAAEEATRAAAFSEIAGIDVSRENEERVSILGKSFLDDDGLPAHVFIFGGDPDALREWVFVTGSNEFFHSRTGEQVSRAAFDLSLAKVTPSVQITKDGGSTENKKFPASRTLVEFLGGAVVSGSMYRPDIREPLFSYDQKNWINSYLRASVPLADPAWIQHEAWHVVRDHIHNVLPDGADILIQWMAHNVQHPGLKILWAPVLVGVEGDGKTTIGMDVMAAAMGAGHVRPVSPEAMFSEFTGWASGACVRVLEEIRIQGERRTAAMDKLKPLITNSVIEVVRKGADGNSVPNVTNYIALTNHIDALAISAGDRRWGVWRTRFRDRDHLLREIKQSYWDRLRWAIEQHPGVIRGWLLNVDISGFDRTKAPPTSAAKLAMIEASGSPSTIELREILALGGPGITAEAVATDCINDRLRESGGRQLNTSTLSSILTEAGWRKHDLTVKWNKRNRRIYYRPDQFQSPAGSVELSQELRLHLAASALREDDGGEADEGRDIL